MKTLVGEWVKRLIGYGSIAVSGVIYTKVNDPELAGWIGSGVALLGGLVLNKCLPWIFPTREKINQPPPLLPPQR